MVGNVTTNLSSVCQMDVYDESRGSAPLTGPGAVRCIGRQRERDNTAWEGRRIGLEVWFYVSCKGCSGAAVWRVLSSAESDSISAQHIEYVMCHPPLGTEGSGPIARWVHSQQRVSWFDPPYLRGT